MHEWINKKQILCDLFDCIHIHSPGYSAPLYYDIVTPFINKKNPEPA